MLTRTEAAFFYEMGLELEWREFGTADIFHRVGCDPRHLVPGTKFRIKPKEDTDVIEGTKGSTDNAG